MMADRPETFLTGPATGLYDHWVLTNGRHWPESGDQDIGAVMWHEANKMCLAVAKQIGDDYPLFNEYGARFLGAFMAAKLRRKSGSVCELLLNRARMEKVFAREAKFHSGQLAKMLKEAAAQERKFLHSAMESIGFTRDLPFPVRLKSGSIVFDQGQMRSLH